MLLLLLLGAPPAPATTLRHLDLDALCAASTDIVVGRVETVRSRWSGDGTTIVTEISVTPSERLKGNGPAENIVLLQLGGEVDGMEVVVDAAPVFRLGEEAILFVRRDRAGRAAVTGMAQGKFDIVTEPESGERTVRRGVPGLQFEDARTLKRSAGPLARKGVALVRFLDEIRSATKRADAGGVR